MVTVNVIIASDRFAYKHNTHTANMIQVDEKVKQHSTTTVVISTTVWRGQVRLRWKMQTCLSSLHRCQLQILNDETPVLKIGQRKMDLVKMVVYWLMCSYTICQSCIVCSYE